MSALDDAIATHVAHAACAVGDPLTEALQAQADTAAHAGATLEQEQWDRTVAAVPMPAWVIFATLAMSLVLAALVSVNAARTRALADAATPAAVAAAPASAVAHGGQP